MSCATRARRRRRFPDLRDRGSMWQLLLAITARKVTHRHRHDQQRRRDVRRNLSDSIFLQAGAASPHTVEMLTSREPTPEFAAEFVETCESLSQSLDDPALQQVV